MILQQCANVSEDSLWESLWYWTRELRRGNILYQDYKPMAENKKPSEKQKAVLQKIQEKLKAAKEDAKAMHTALAAADAAAADVEQMSK